MGIEANTFTSKLLIPKRFQRCFRVRLSLGSSIKREENNRAHQKVEVKLCFIGEPITKEFTTEYWFLVWFELLLGFTLEAELVSIKTLHSSALWKINFRVTRPTFNALCYLVRGDLQKQHTRMHSRRSKSCRYAVEVSNRR